MRSPETTAKKIKLQIYKCVKLYEKQWKEIDALDIEKFETCSGYENAKDVMIKDWCKTEGVIEGLRMALEIVEGKR